MFDIIKDLINNNCEFTVIKDHILLNDKSISCTKLISFTTSRNSYIVHWIDTFNEEGRCILHMPCDGMITKDLRTLLNDYENI